MEGHCLCGAVRYVVDGAPVQRTNCHCTMCRRASGAPFVAWFSVAREQLRYVTGQPARYRSSSHGTRTLCAACGTPLTFESSREPDYVDVTVCSLSDPEAVAPEQHIFTSTQLSWVKLADGLPRYPHSSSAAPDGGTGAARADGAEGMSSVDAEN